MLVAPSHPKSDSGEDRGSSGQSGLSADSVECSGEVQLEQHLAVTGVVALGPCPNGVNPDFHARLDPKETITSTDRVFRGN